MVKGYGNGKTTNHNLPIKGASPTQGAPYSSEESSPVITDKNQDNSFNNPKPLLESSNLWDVSC